MPTPSKNIINKPPSSMLSNGIIAIIPAKCCETCLRRTSNTYDYYFCEWHARRVNPTDYCKKHKWRE